VCRGANTFSFSKGFPWRGRGDDGVVVNTSWLLEALVRLGEFSEGDGECFLLDILRSKFMKRLARGQPHNRKNDMNDASPVTTNVRGNTSLSENLTYLTPIEAIRVAAILEHTSDKLKLLSMLNSEPSSFENVAVQKTSSESTVAQILEEQKRLGARYEELSYARGHTVCISYSLIILMMIKKTCILTPGRPYFYRRTRKSQ